MIFNNKEESEKLQKSILSNWMEFRESMKMVNLCQQMKHAILNDWLKNSEAEAQILAKPKVMARPVIVHDGAYYLGWDDTVQQALLGA